MRTLGFAAVITGLMAAATLGVSSHARANDMRFSFDVGNVAFAYNDGWWDNDHHWHKWHSRHEARMFKDHYHDRYHDWKHTREHNHGWHDR